MLEEPKCWLRGCKHYLGISQPDGTELSEVNYCEAFPDGIPWEIAHGTNPHDEVFPDQAGDIVFKGAGKSFCSVCGQELSQMDAGMFCTNTDCPVEDNSDVWKIFMNAEILFQEGDRFLVKTGMDGEIPVGYIVLLDDEIANSTNLYSPLRSGEWDTVVASEETKKKVLDILRKEMIG